MRIFNSLIEPKNSKQGTLWGGVNIRSVAKYQKQIEGRTFGDIKKFSKKKSQGGKNGGIS